MRHLRRGPYGEYAAYVLGHSNVGLKGYVLYCWRPKRVLEEEGGLGESPVKVPAPRLDESQECPGADLPRVCLQRERQQ